MIGDAGGEHRFYYFLAETLGMAVDDMLDKMTSREITNWRAYFKVKRYEEKQQMQKAKSQRRRL